MSTTGLVWLLCYLAGIFRGLSVPVFLVCAYLLTFYVSPLGWWWGKDGLFMSVGRWNFYAALLLAISVFMNSSRVSTLQSVDYFFILLLLVYIVNCTAVHFLLADYPEVSYKEWDLLWKNVLTAALFRLAIRDQQGLHWVIGISTACCCYVGYEIVINDAGRSIHGRLEGLDFPGASGSNGCAAVMSMVFPFLAYLVICKPFRYSRILGLISAPLILDSVLRFNSRGAFLGAAVAGMVLITMARGKARSYAIYSVVLGISAFVFQAKDDKIWERLFSINASAEERDNSATIRLESWKAGMQMISDYPFGSGGRSAFISPRGNQYITFLGYNEYRSVHNGYISIAAGWGIQGFVLITSAFILAMARTWLAIRQFQRLKDEKNVFLGATIFSAFTGQATCAMFGDYYDGEWFLWLAGYGLAYASFSQNSMVIESLVSDEDRIGQDGVDVDDYPHSFEIENFPGERDCIPVGDTQRS